MDLIQGLKKSGSNLIDSLKTTGQNVLESNIVVQGLASDKGFLPGYKEAYEKRANENVLKGIQENISLGQSPMTAQRNARLGFIPSQLQEAAIGSINPIGGELKGVGKESESLIKRVIKKYGTTDIDESVGFITPTGKAIDSSGYKLGGPAVGRSIDHREISLDALPSNSKITEGTDALIEFMNKTNSVRVKSAGENGLNIDIVGYPTEKQFSYINKMSKNSNGIYADISTANGGVAKSGEFNSFKEYKKFVDDYFINKEAKYPNKIYKAYNDYFGTNTSFKDIDKISVEELRNYTSSSLSGGKEEFDKLIGIKPNKLIDGLKSSGNKLIDELRK